jgi:DNA-binding NarL/FixJ family response regulator
VGVSVLLVDDDRDFLALARRVCESMGAEVVGTATDAASAVALANDAKPQAVLVDVGLPDRSGIDLAEELASLPWSPRVVLTSTDGDVETGLGSSKETETLPFIPKEQLATERLRSLLGLD